MQTARPAQGGCATARRGRLLCQRDRGAALEIKATVKEHGLYKDERQTIVQRVKIAA